MYKIYHLDLWISLIAISFNLRAQTTYSADPQYFQIPSSYYFLKDTLLQKAQYIDTSINHFQNNLPFYFNGQIGSAQPNYLLENTDTDIGNRVFGYYYPDILSKENYTVYRTKGLFSQWQGIAGSKDEQHLKVLFTSPIKTYHQITFYLKRSTYTGFYQRQKASITNLFTDYHYYGKKRLSIDGNIILNIIKHQENGGIVKDTLSYADLFKDKILIPVALTDARKNIQRNQIEYRMHYITNNDSANPQALSISVKGQQDIFQYADNYPRQGYYSFIFLDTLKTNDSLHSFKIEMPCSYSLKYKHTLWQLSYYYQWNKIHLFFDTLFQNHFLEGKITLPFQWKNIHGKQENEWQYIVQGTQKNNYSVRISAEFNYQRIQVNMHLQSFQQSPAFQQNFWYSNHFIWFNRFQNIHTHSLHASFSYNPSFLLNYRMYAIDHFIYFTDNYPQQYNQTLFIHQLKLTIDKIFFKHLGIQGEYNYQWKSANVIALPSHFIKADVFYQGRWFQQNLLVNIGTQYTSSLLYFDTYQYNPATSLYSIKTTSFQAGKYPQIALYFSGRIKPVNFFIRMDNILSEFIAQPYYYLPHYMMPDRTFRMGISWMFFD